VLRMTYEEQGVYRRLLWISLQNRGLPESTEAIAELLRLPFGGLSAKRFVAKVWPKIAPCWTPNGEGRLLQRRQEDERARREASVQGEGGQDDISERMRQLANRRWRRGADAGTHADAYACRNASRIAEDDASRNADASPPPAPPPVQTKPNQPQSARARACGADADADAIPHADADADAQPNDPVVQIQRILLQTGLRSGMLGFTRSQKLLQMAEKLRPSGITADDVRELWALAQEKTTGDAGALLSHWFDDDGGGGWRAVLDEQRMHQKEAAIAIRNRESADVLDRIYGS
jgi:hypothetical protein